MKKIFSFFILFLIITYINAQVFEDEIDIDQKGKYKIVSFTLNAGIRNLSTDIYGKVYGKNNFTLSADVGFKLWKFFEITLHTSYFSVKGELTYTKEESTLTITPVELGVRFLIGKKKIFPYLGAGGGYYFFNEKNVIGAITKSQPGLFAEIGLRYYFLKSLFFNLKAKYIYFKVKPDEMDENSEENIYPENRDLGGFAIMAGIGFSF